jgi:hypothetical protein
MRRLTISSSEFLQEVVPKARVIALLVNPNQPSTENQLDDVKEAVHSLGSRLNVLNAASERDLDAAFVAARQGQCRNSLCLPLSRPKSRQPCLACFGRARSFGSLPSAIQTIPNAFRFRSRVSLEFELIAVRHQLTVLRRQRPGRPQLSSLDRLLWVWLYRIWPQVIDAMVLVKPATV